MAGRKQQNKIKTQSQYIDKTLAFTAGVFRFLLTYMALYFIISNN